MTHFMTDLWAFLLVLGPIVFIHELGHFIAAKSFKVRVDVFSLGFGKRLFGFRYGDTDYRVSLLPLGGFVKMAGENPGEPLTGAPGEFLGKPRWQRFVIAAAGPMMNFVLAIGLLVPFYMAHYPRHSYLDQPALIASTIPGSPAANAGLKPLDRIVGIDGVKNPTWEQAENQAELSIGHPIDLAVLRQNRLIQTQVTPVEPSNANGQDALGALPVERVVINAVAANSAAQQDGLRAGDRIVAFNGQRTTDPNSFAEMVRATDGRPIRLTVERQGKTEELTVAARPMPAANGKKPVYRLGVIVGPDFEFVHLPFHQALDASLRENEQDSLLILDLVGRLLTSKSSIRNLQGPVGIATIAGQAFREPSSLPLIGLIAAISLNLGILNLLPIPVLDGGMILMLFVEGILRHDLSLKIKERIYQAGFAFLLVLMTVVLYNDILRQITQR